MIYVVGLDHYNAVLFENNKVNAMLESVKLFEQLVNSRFFYHSKIILFFNKDDIFRKKLRIDNVPLSACFSEIGQWPNKDEYWIYPHFKDNSSLTQNENDANFECYHDDAIKFIQTIFTTRNRSKKFLYKHVTIASQERFVERVFWDVENIIIRSHMKMAGLINMDKNSVKVSNQTVSEMQQLELPYVSTMMYKNAK